MDTSLPKRRKFLESAAITSAAAAALPYGAYAQGSDEIRVGLIGCGGRGTGAASQALQATDGVKLWAMADIDTKRLELSHETLTKAVKDPERMAVAPERKLIGLGAYEQLMAMDEVDVVILTTPPGFRPIHFAAAVEAGKHVFMEKPVAVDSTGVRQVIDAAREARRQNLKVGVGFNRRHSPLHESAIAQIHDGVIGDIHTIRLYNCRSGVNKKHLRQPGESELRYQVDNWYYFTWLSGDFLVEQSVHEYDVVRWIKGEQDPVSCQGQGGRLVRTGKDEGHIYDHFDLEYEYADGTVLRAQHRHIPGCWSWFGEKITGTKGKAELSFKKHGQIWRKGEETAFWREREKANSYQIEHDRLFAAIRGNEPFNEAERAAHSTLASIMGRMAAYTGQLITWEDALNSEESLVPNVRTWDDEPPFFPSDDGSYPVTLPGRKLG